MGCRPHMFNLILSLGQDVVSYETLNDGITLDISLWSISQGCTIIQFLLAIITHPLLVILWKLATNVDILGLYLPSRGQQVV